MFSLGPLGCSQLLEALLRNNTIEELSLSGNRAGDSIMQPLLHFLKQPQNNVNRLAIGDNKLTNSGTKILK